MKFENLSTVCISVEKEKDFGYWEINPELKKAYFRDHGTLPPEDKKITYSNYTSIDEYLKSVHDVQYIKTIIPDRKIIFGDTPFCSWSKERTSDDGIVSRVYCQHPALVSIPTANTDSEPKLYCGEHAPIGGGNSAANTFASTASVSARMPK